VDLTLAFVAIWIALTCSLVAVMVIPAPSPASANGAAHQALLTAVCLATVAMGSLAWNDRYVEGAAFGVLAWLLVLPCLWLLRAPDGADGWREEDDDDDDDDPPWPRSPSAPPTPEELFAGRIEPGLAAAHATWKPARIVSPEREREREPVAEAPQRRPARRLRGDDRAVVHARAVAPHVGRQRRASLRRRALWRCRRWLWPAAPGCTSRAPSPPIAHDGRRHTARPERQAGDVTWP
jgi:hypothetical protein